MSRFKREVNHGRCRKIAKGIEMKAAARKATDYLQVGQMVRVPDHIPAPILYSAKNPNGATERIGIVIERFTQGGVAVEFGSTSPKCWDYSNKEALQFCKVY